MLVKHLSFSEHRSLRLNLVLHLTAILQITFHSIYAIKAFLVKIDLLIIFNVHHLVLQELLHVLILPQDGQLFAISFDTILSCIFIDHVGPELVLLFLS